MPNVRFLLGTDGIFDTMETREITEVIRAEEEEKGERLNAKVGGSLNYHFLLFLLFLFF